MNELLAALWIMSYIGFPILLIVSVIATGCISKRFIKKAYRSVKTIALVHLFITSVVTWFIRDGLLGPKSYGTEAFILFIKPMSIFLTLIICAVAIARFIYLGRNKKNSNQNIEPIVTTPVDEVNAPSTQAHV